MDKLMQAASSVCYDYPEISTQLINNIDKMSAKGHIWWNWNGRPFNKHFDIKDISVDNIMEQFADEFAHIPFNCDKAWLGISAGNICSMLPIGYIDMLTCKEMDKYITDRQYLRMWVENNFAIPNYVKVALNQGDYTYVLQHKRLSYSQLTQ